MACKYLKVENQKIPLLGGQAILHKRYICRLKMASEVQRLEVYGKLFEQGLEGSIVTDDCPVAQSGNWDKCPFFVKGFKN